MATPRPSSARSELLVFGAPALEEPEIREVIDCLRSGWLGTGPRVARFEQRFAEYKQVPEAIAVSSCTAALHLSLLAAGIGPGDEVVTTPLTFCATVNAIIHAGATPVLADVDPHTMNIDPARIEAKITSRTRALLPVHLAGRPCAMEALGAIAARHDLAIIEDCAHAVEARLHGRGAGTIGDFGCFSFYATKNLCTGEGGMVIARRPEQAERIRMLSRHGLSRDAWRRVNDDGYCPYAVVEAGFKYNMMDLQAAIGIHQLERIERNWPARRAIWDRYLHAFADLPVTLPSPPESGTRHARHLFTLLIDPRRAGVSRDAFLQGLRARNIGAGVHYLSLAEHPCYQQRFGWRGTDCPHALQIGRQTLSLPLSPALSPHDVEDVIAAVRDIIHEGRTPIARRAA